MVLRPLLCVFSLLIKLQTSRRICHLLVDRKHAPIASRNWESACSLFLPPGLVAQAPTQRLYAVAVRQNPSRVEAAVPRQCVLPCPTPQNPHNSLYIGRCIQPVGSHSYSLLIVSNTRFSSHLKLGLPASLMFRRSQSCPSSTPLVHKIGLRHTHRHVGGIGSLLGEGGTIEPKRVMSLRSGR